MEFVISNGQIVKKQEFIPVFCDGSMIFAQKIWFGHGGIPLFFENLAILENELNAFQLKLPDWFGDVKEVLRITKRMLNKNKFFRSGIVSIIIYTGKPEPDFLISSEAFDEFSFPFSKRGIMLGFSNLPLSSQHPLGRYVFFNSLIWKVEESKYTESSNSVFLNEKGNIANCAGANLYCIKNKVLITPSLETGCWTGTIHRFILDAAREIELKTDDSATITKSDLLLMDEIFIASEEKGIQWVMGIGSKRFVHFQADLICGKLNDLLKAKVA
jgi:branched-chain amino acid aminotransferase